MRIVHAFLLALLALPLGAAAPESPVAWDAAVRREGADVAVTYSAWVATPDGQERGASGGGSSGGDDPVETWVYVGCKAAAGGGYVFEWYETTSGTHFVYYTASYNCDGARVYSI